MIIKCVKCKREFEQKRYERQCGCRPSNTSEYRRQFPRVDSPYAEYMSQIRRYFQDPIYQHYRLHNTDYLRLVLRHGRYAYEHDPYPEN